MKNVVVGMWVVFLVACGSDNDGGGESGGPATCASAANAICEKAGECGTPFMLDILEFSSVAECKGFLSAFCADDMQDWQQCQDELPTAQCNGNELVPPASCDEEDDEN